MKYSASNFLVFLVVLATSLSPAQAAMERATAKERARMAGAHSGLATEEDLFRDISGSFLREDYPGVRRLSRQYRQAGHTKHVEAVDELDALSAGRP